MWSDTPGSLREVIREREAVREHEAVWECEAIREREAIRECEVVRDSVRPSGSVKLSGSARLSRSVKLSGSARLSRSARPSGSARLSESLERKVVWRRDSEVVRKCGFLQAPLSCSRNFCVVYGHGKNRTVRCRLEHILSTGAEQMSRGYSHTVHSTQRVASQP